MTLLNKMTRRAATLLLAAGVAGGLAAPASALSPEEIQSKGTLTVGVLADFPPFGGTDENQEPAGYDIDVAKLLGEKMGVEVEIVPVTGPNRIPYLLTNRIDVLVAALGINEERAQQVAFSKPYSTLDVMVMAPESVEINGPEDLANLTVGVTRAGSQDTFVTQVAPAGTDIRRYDDDAVSLQAMISGQVDALGGSNIHLAVLKRDHADLNVEKKFPLFSQGNGIGLRQGDDALKSYLNDFIDDVAASGELDAIHQEWFGTPLPELPPAPEYIQ